jgi:hypothetical protein
MAWTPDVTKFEKLEDPRFNPRFNTKDQQIASGILPLATVHQFRNPRQLYQLP